MSVRLNTVASDHLAVNALLGVEADEWFVSGFFKFINMPGAGNSANIVTLSMEEAGSFDNGLMLYVNGDDNTLYLWESGVYSSAEGEDAVAVISEDVWYRFILERTTATTITCRLWADTTSTTPLGTGTLTVASNLNLDDAGAAPLDWVIWGKTFDNSMDGEVENGRVVVGVTLTNAQALSEHQSYDYVLGTGTPYAEWSLKDVDADDDGLNDSTANSNHLTNTGCIAGASTPALLGAGAPTGTESGTLTEATTGLLTATVAGSES